jgi:Tfp pilus assembly protein PilO
MLNSPREKYLAVIAAVCLTSAVGWESCSALLLQPLAGLEQELQSAAKAVENGSIEELRLMHAVRQLKQLRAVSLPADPGQATAVYQAWLIQQLEAAGLQTPSVSPVQAIPDDALGHRLPFSVECTGSAAAIADFIDRFSGTQLLHRMTSLQITSISMGVDDSLQLAVSIEAIALPDAPAIDSIPTNPETTDPDSTLLATLTENNIFTGQMAELIPDPPITTEPLTSVDPIASVDHPNAETPAPPESTPEPQPLGMTAAEACRFTGSVLSGKSRRAWFVDLRSGDIYWAGRNQLLAIPDLPLPILDVRDDMVIVEYCADPRIVPLGDSIVTPSVLPADLAALAQPATIPVQRRNQSIPETNQLQPETANYESDTAPAAFPQPNSNPSTDRSNLPVPASTPAFRAVPSALPRPSTSVLR